jgi:magnesium-transporting ATPase (P-type)
MAVAKRPLTREEAKAFLDSLTAAKHLPEGRADRLSEIYLDLEDNMTYLGVTGVEDKMQDGVEQTMGALRAAGCRVWMLTGDKLETAMSISLSCNHMSTGLSPTAVELSLQQCCFCSGWHMQLFFHVTTCECACSC